MSLLSHLNTLESIGLVRVAQVEPDLAYLFRHALVMDAAYTSILESDRKKLHQLVGETVEQLYHERLNEIAATLARHFERGGDAERGLKYYLMAAASALDAYANQEAEEYFTRSLELVKDDTQRASIYSSLGEALFNQSRFQEAIDSWQPAIELYKRENDNDQVARLYARTARAAWHAGDTPLGLKYCEEGLDAVRGTPDSCEMAQLTHEAARAYFFNGMPKQALPLCEQALEMAERMGAISVQADARATYGVLPDVTPDAAMKALKESVELAESAGLLSIATRAHHNLGNILTSARGDLLSARKHYRKAAEIARIRGGAYEQLYSLISATGISLQLGEIAVAEEIIATLDELAGTIPDPTNAILNINSIRSAYLLYVDKFAESLDLARLVKEEARERGDLQILTNSANGIADVLLEMDRLGDSIDWDEVENNLIEAIEISERGLGDPVFPYSQMVEYKARQKMRDEANEYFQKLEIAAKGQESVFFEPAVNIAAMEIALLEENWDAALAATENLVKFQANMGLRPDWARCLQMWAEVHMRKGDLSDLESAQALLRESLTIFESLGMQSYIEKIKDQLRYLHTESYQQALKHEAVAQEMERAGRIQADFLPEEPPEIPNWQVAAKLQPARQTSGDFYDFIHLPDGRLGFVVADVAEKGAGAALYMTSSRTLLRTFAVEHPDHPAEVIKASNQRILADTHGGLFITTFYGVLNFETGELIYCNAGHNPPILCNPSSSQNTQTLRRTGMPLGIDLDASWEQKSLKINSGESLILYTDGVTEAQNADKAFFEEARLLDTVTPLMNNTAAQIQNGILTAVSDFVGEAPQFDDITVMVIGRD